MKKTVFISYSSKDKELAKMLVHYLEEMSIEVWYDEHEILVGHDVTEKVYDGLRSCQFVAIILTKNSVSSQWVREELNHAKQRAITENGKRLILPLLFEDCQIPEPIKTLKYADFRSSYEEGLKEFSKSLGIQLLSPIKSPIKDSFFQKAVDAIQIAEALNHKMTIQEAIEIGMERNQARRTGFFHSLEGVGNRFFSDSWCGSDHDHDNMESLIRDYSNWIMWAKFVDVLKKNYNNQKVDLLSAFSDAIRSSIYSKYSGIKNGPFLLAEISKIASLLKSLER